MCYTFELYFHIVFVCVKIPVGSGHVFSVDPTRIAVKRVLLSGYPFRSHARKAVVRFMFFNRADVEWFKPVELKTRYGLRGHIKEPLGTSRLCLNNALSIMLQSY